MLVADRDYRGLVVLVVVAIVASVGVAVVSLGWVHWPASVPDLHHDSRGPCLPLADPTQTRGCLP
jgi:hypothetical protein